RGRGRAGPWAPFRGVARSGLRFGNRVIRGRRRGRGDCGERVAGSRVARRAGARPSPGKPTRGHRQCSSGRGPHEEDEWKTIVKRDGRRKKIVTARTNWDERGTRGRKGAILWSAPSRSMSPGSGSRAAHGGGRRGRRCRRV